VVYRTAYACGRDASKAPPRPAHQLAICQPPAAKPFMHPQSTARPRRPAADVLIYAPPRPEAYFPFSA
jgi:hypothetical protein